MGRVSNGIAAAALATPGMAAGLGVGTAAAAGENVPISVASEMSSDRLSGHCVYNIDTEQSACFDSFSDALVRAGYDSVPEDYSFQEWESAWAGWASGGPEPLRSRSEQQFNPTAVTASGTFALATFRPCWSGPCANTVTIVGSNCAGGHWDVPSSLPWNDNIGQATFNACTKLVFFQESNSCSWGNSNTWTGAPGTTIQTTGSSEKCVAFSMA